MNNLRMYKHKANNKLIGEPKQTNKKIRQDFPNN